MESVATYFDGQSTAEVAMTLLKGHDMLKDIRSRESFMQSAAGEGWTFLATDLRRYDSIDTELDQIAKEFEQTSRRLVAMYA